MNYPELLDLRMRNGTASTTISVYGGRVSYNWIYAPGIRLTEQETPRPRWRLDALVPQATSRDHTQAIAFSMYLDNTTIREIHGRHVWIDGFIDRERPDLFRVPEPGWNQFEGATKCGVCLNKKHVILRKDRHIPPPNHKLFKTLCGKRIKIITGFGWSKRKNNDDEED